MFWFCAALSAAGVLESVICSCLVAEFAGYWLHRLLHSEKFPMLSRNHIAHHLILYGPTQPMRADSYKDATHGRFSLGNVGLEWLAPSAVLLIVCWAFLFVLRIPLIYQVIALGTLSGRFSPSAFYMTPCTCAMPGWLACPWSRFGFGALGVFTISTITA